ncbi:MAG TPA: DegT/DnrJ/EryC1/StrS family aminotransferase [Thermodesulfobacteriota bacterium]|nr:DegT/DnrJ/EryC1/StrS family aminotransferase [Thermodesulfobacteriota bacterium]
MHIPLLDLKAQYATIRDEIKPAIDEVLESQLFILGDKVIKLEEAIANYSGSKFAVGVASGTDAILLALMALGVGYGDSVITTPYTFFATAGSIARLGALPVFVDIDPETYNISPQKIVECLKTASAKEKIKAIMPVHLYGQCADMDPILAIARDHGLPIIEDAAQAIGSRYKERKAGAMSEFGCFSFFPSKNLGGFGDGGMVTTDNETLAEKVGILRVHGSKPKYYHKVVGLNSRLDALQAVALLVKIKHLDQWTAKRRKNADYYRERFQKNGLNEFVGLPKVEEGNFHIYNQFVIRVKKRDELQKFLTQAGIGTEIYYPIPLHLQECFLYLGYHEGDFPESEKAARETLALPIYPELTIAQQDYIVEKIKEFFNDFWG